MLLDADLVWSNCFEFNYAGSDISNDAVDVSEPIGATPSDQVNQNVRYVEGSSDCLSLLSSLVPLALQLLYIYDAL
jgi:hypothetical protein